MRLVFINRFYWPDEPATGQLLTDLAERLAARGHHVTIITSHSGDATLPRRETRAAVNIVRTSGTRWRGAGLFGKAANWGTFYLAACWRLTRQLHRGDVAIAMTDPPLLTIGVWFVAALRGARTVQWIQDIYPELAIELAGQNWLRVLRPLRNRAWRRALGCVTVGSDMAAALLAAGVAPENHIVIPNWAPAGVSPPPADATAALRASWGLAEKFVVAYSGNLGRVHDLEPVLGVAERLGAEPSIVFLFIGDGAQRAALETRARQLGLTNVHFRAAQSRAMLATSLAAGDAHLVTLLPGCERLVFPSKFYGVLAVGRPVIFIGPRDCELARLVASRQVGVAFERTQISALADSLRALASDSTRRAHYGAAAAAFAAELGGADAAAARWHEWLTAHAG